MSPLAPLRALGDRLYAYTQRNEHTLVHEPGRMPRLSLRGLLVWLGTVACWAIHDTAPWWWLTLLAGFVVTVAVARGTWLPAQRSARAYRHGWLDGRAAFVLSMGEAQRQGLTPEQWIGTEAARDWSHVSDEPPPWWVDGE